MCVYVSVRACVCECVCACMCECMCACMCVCVCVKEEESRNICCLSVFMGK